MPGAADRDRAPRVYLIGFMGAGKSTVGPLLAARLGGGFADLDSRIEAEAGATVSEIFAREGEPAFRERERAALREVAEAASPRVIGLGGGAWLHAGNRAALLRDDVVVYLRAEAHTLAARLGAEGSRTRPLLAATAEDPAARADRIRELLAARAPVYEEAPLVIDTDGLTPGAVAERIARLLSRSEAFAVREIPAP